MALGLVNCKYIGIDAEVRPGEMAWDNNSVVKTLRSHHSESDDTSRKLWVVAVLAFWISLGITLTTMLITGKLDLILVSITLGLMVLGVWRVSL